MKAINLNKPADSGLEILKVVMLAAWFYSAIILGCILYYMNAKKAI